MFLHIALALGTICSSQGLPRPESPQAVQTSQLASRPIEQLKPLFRGPQKPEYQTEFQYNLSLFGTHLEIPTYNFIREKHFPRSQPQVVVYNGGPATDQRFLLQHGSSLQNFLVSHEDPNVIMKDKLQVPAPANVLPRPVFVAGYPKPAHIPPVEKDAEEVPTNQSTIPTLTPTERKPEQLETFNEDETSKKHATEADVLAASDRNPTYNPKINLRPGQRFFILNGQQIFSNVLYPNQIQSNLKFAHSSFNFNPQMFPKTLSPYPTFIIRNEPIGNIPDYPEFNDAQLKQANPANLVLLNQPGSFQYNIFKNPASPNFKREKIDKAQFREDSSVENFDQLLRLQNYGEQDDESVVIDAGEQQDNQEGDITQREYEVVAADKPVEPTIAQAQPGAIALAGLGGVAAAGPRATAFVGKEGVAISSPQATAVAGPRRDGMDEVVQGENKEKRKQ